MNSYIQLNGVTKKFGTKLVLDNLSLTIPQGKISFIIGRSGEGKSVTLKHIVGILKPDSGEIFIGGQAMHTATEREWELRRKKIGILFQEGALFDSMTVWENISFPIVNHLKMSDDEIDKTVENLLESVGLKGLASKYPAELSIGERKRVGLARALALNPELLLYDEPTTSMDPFVSDLIDTLILEMSQKMEGLTSVVISHDVVSMRKVADYIFLLHQGQIYFEGVPSDFENSEDPLVKQFMNGELQGPLEVPL